MPSDCNELELSIRRLIADGATRYRRDKTYASIRRLVAQFALECSRAQAEYLSVALDLTFAKDTVPNLLRRLEVLLSTPEIPPRTQVATLNLSAKLGFASMSQVENYAIRERALSIARDNKLATEEIVTLTHWVIAHHYRHEYVKAKERLAEAEKLLASLAKESIKSDPALAEAASRILGHKAKILFATTLTGAATDPSATIEQGNRLYERAIQSIADNDHHRVNLQIEWAEELQELGAAGWPAVLPLATSVLDEAHGGLDSHNCDLCRGYFFLVRAKVLLERSRHERILDPRTARLGCEMAVVACESSLKYFKKLQHPNIQCVAETQEKLMIELESLNRGRKIFLSHKSGDKSLVLRFKETLELLKFEPWLDSDAMPAGVGLERGILKGFKDSCAVVFFITPEFKDESFLATEIEYAISEKRSKSDLFSIITLVFVDANGRKGVVPDLLKNYVWKEPPDELAAIRELVRALPLAVSYPDWRKNQPVLAS